MSGRLWRKGIAALFALQVADIASTFVGLSRGAREVGVIAGPVGGAGLLVVPFVGMALQLLLVALLPDRVRALGWTVALGVTGLLLVENVVVIAGL